MVTFTGIDYLLGGSTPLTTNRGGGKIQDMITSGTIDAGKLCYMTTTTGERYLPTNAIKALSPSEYAATTRAKRAGKAAGKQFVKQPAGIAKKTARYR